MVSAMVFVSIVKLTLGVLLNRDNILAHTFLYALNFLATLPLLLT